MKNHEYRWQDFVISPRRAAADLIGSALVLALLAGAALAGGGPQRDHSDHATTVKTASMAEQAPTLAKSAKRRVIPRRTEDWL
jgi:hypothetical protein